MLEDHRWTHWIATTTCRHRQVHLDIFMAPSSSFGGPGLHPVRSSVSGVLRRVCSFELRSLQYPGSRKSWDPVFWKLRNSNLKCSPKQLISFREQLFWRH